MTLQVLIRQKHKSRCAVSVAAFPTENMTHTPSLTGDRLPIMRKAVRVESKRKAILFVGAAGMLRLLTLAVSAELT